ncbi:MAG TPA: hypothetical protein VMT53_23925 [Terriglobales bacterium]|nr:hypothetical protein [Terriglobales bacterium]
MFLVSHSLDYRAQTIRGFLQRHPSIALIVAAVYFEWTICRAIVALSSKPNSEVRKSLEQVYGLDYYRDLWWNELRNQVGVVRLPDIVDWGGVRRAFSERNRLSHGRTRHTRNMAQPHVEALLAAVIDVNEYCRNRGIDLNKRLRVRKTER